MTVYTELAKIKLQRKDDETIDAFSRRATKKINDLPDADWKALKGPVQTWSNEVLKAIEANRDAPELPELEGWPEEEETSGEETSESEGEETAEGGDNDAEEDDEEEEGDGEEAEETEEESSDGEEAEGAAEEGASDEESNSGDDQEEAAEVVEEPPVRKRLTTGKKANRKASSKTTTSTKREKEKPVKTSVKKKDEPAPKTAAKAKAAEPRGANGNARTRIGDGQVIKLLTKGNPHREGTKLYGYFAKYKDGMTVDAALKAKIPQKNIYYEAGLNNIKLVSSKK